MNTLTSRGVQPARRHPSDSGSSVLQVSVRQHTPAYASLRQHASAYASMRYTVIQAIVEALFYLRKRKEFLEAEKKRKIKNSEGIQAIVEALFNIRKKLDQHQIKERFD